MYSQIQNVTTSHSESESTRWPCDKCHDRVVACGKLVTEIFGDAKVGRFLIVNSVVPYSCCLTDSVNLYFGL